MLFKDIRSVQAVFPSMVDANWEKVSPQIEVTEQETFRSEILGPELYDALHAAYQASIATSPTALPEKWAAILPNVQRAVAHLAWYEAIDLMNIVVGTGGAVVGVTDKQERAPMWAVENFKTAALNRAYSFINLLVGQLTASAANYPEWNSSGYREQITGSMVPMLSHATPVVRINAWMLHQLQPAIRRAQGGQVRKILGETAYQALLTAVHADTVTAGQKAVLEYVRPAVLFAAIAEMIPQLGISIDRKGVWTWESTSSGSQIAGGPKSAATERRLALAKDQQALADAALTALEQLINPHKPTGRQGFGHGGGYLF